MICSHYKIAKFTDVCTIVYMMSPKMFACKSAEYDSESKPQPLVQYSLKAVGLEGQCGFPPIAAVWNMPPKNGKKKQNM